MRTKLNDLYCQLEKVRMLKLPFILLLVLTVSSCSSGGGSDDVDTLDDGSGSLQVISTSEDGAASFDMASRLVNVSVEDADSGNLVQGVEVHAVEIESGTILWTFDPSGLYIPATEFIPFQEEIDARVRFSAIDIAMVILAANDVSQSVREYHNDPASFRSKIGADGRVTERCVVGDGNDLLATFNGLYGAGTLISSAIRYLSGGRLFSAGFTATTLSNAIAAGFFFSIIDNSTTILSRDHKFCWSEADGFFIPAIDVTDESKDDGEYTDEDFRITQAIADGDNYVVDRDSSGGGTLFPIDVYYEGLPEAPVSFYVAGNVGCQYGESCVLGGETFDLQANPYTFQSRCRGKFLFPYQQYWYIYLRDGNGVTTDPYYLEWTCAFLP